MHNPVNFLAVTLIKSPKSDISKFHSKTCKDATAIFYANGNRAKNIAALPGMSFLLGDAFGRGEFKAMNGAGRKDEKWIKGRTERHLNERMKSHEALWPEALVLATEKLEDYTDRLLENHRETLENCLKTILVDSWACIEILCKQLYEGAEKENGWGELTEPERLRENRKSVFTINFMSRQSMECSFDLRFKNPAIKKLFKKKCLVGLSQLRNVIAHNAGHADDKFANAAKHGKPWLNRYIGKTPEQIKHIRIDGREIQRLVDCAFIWGYKLIEEVDKTIK